jgi:DNA-binding response OmpR family regulator
MVATPRLLLVDAIPDHVISYSRAFTQEGYRVDLAETAHEGLVAARQHTPDCIVIDVRLPDLSGWDLCRELKQGAETRHIPVVVLTPDTTRDHALHSARVLCSAWMAQPSQPEDLLRAIQHVLSQEESEPRSPDEAVLGVAVCPACESDRVRATLRVSPVQYYSCRACGHGWRVEAL